MERKIVSFHLDAEGDWVADLECGHRQHVRHRPPFVTRPWVVEEAGRAARLGTPLDCPLCDRGEAPDEGGDPACWVDRVCEECGALVGPGPHRPGCPAGAEAPE